MSRTNKERVLLIADALGGLCDKVVFVGGSVSEFYCDELSSLKFHNDTREGAPMCRFIFGENNIVDIMPVESTAIGESNRWYKPGFSFRKAYEIAAGRTIYLLPVGYYIATKLEALFSRGGKDYRGASDFEDIVYVSNSCKDLYQSVSQSRDADLREYLSNSFSNLLNRENIDEEIECALFSGDEERKEHIKDIFREIAMLH